MRILTALFCGFLILYAFALYHYDRIRVAREKKIHMIVYGDAVFYYSNTRSILFDRDLDTTNEARHYWHRDVTKGWTARTGKLNNYVPIGSSFLWIPFVGLAHLFTWGDGFSFVYPAAAAFGSALLAWIALVMIYRKCGMLIVPVALWFGTNLAYYMSLEPLTSHACAFFVVTVFALSALEPGESPRKWAGLGALLGLAMLVRTEHALLALILLPHRRAACWAAFLATAALVFLPQFLIWKHVVGSWWPPRAWASEPYPKHLLSVLFSPNHGLFLWHPVYLLGALGLFAPGPKRLRWTAGSVILGAVLFFSLRPYWHGFGSFGNRYFVGLGFFFAVGLWNGARWLRARGWRDWMLWSASGVLLLWNGVLLYFYLVKEVKLGIPVFS